MEQATLGAGCFWCVEAVFQRLNGVVSVQPGYAGGHVNNPTYQQVCDGNTGHAEVAQITFDPNIVTYDEILEVYWYTHDPTTLNRQGNDIGEQYRSVIFYHNEEQKLKAESYKKKLEEAKLWADPIITQIEPLTEFFPAEAYHYNYFNDNSNQPYCAMVVKPKVEKFKKIFEKKLKKDVR